jgi:hypothetical protein
MPSSTSPLESGDRPRRGRLAALHAGPIVPPIAWLLSLQLGYALSYAACGAQTRWFLHLAVLGPLVLIAASAYGIWQAHRSREDDEHWPTWLAYLGLMSCAWFALVIVATDIPTMVLSPCW